MIKAKNHLSQSGNVSHAEKDPFMNRVKSIRQGLRVHQLSGMAAANSGDYHKAVENFQLSVDADPSNARAHVNLATALILTDNRDLGYKHLRLAVERNPSLHTANYNLASLLAEDGNDNESLKFYKNASKNSSNHRDTYFGLAHCLMRLNQPFEAIKAYRQVIKIDPTSKAAQYWMAMAYAKIGKYQDAIKLLTESLKINPRQIEVANALSRILAVAPQSTKQQKLRSLELAQLLMKSKRTVKHGVTLAMAEASNLNFESAMKNMHQVLSYSNKNKDNGLHVFYQKLYDNYQLSFSAELPWHDNHSIYSPAASIKLHMSSIKTQ